VGTDVWVHIEDGRSSFLENMARIYKTGRRHALQHLNHHIVFVKVSSFSELRRQKLPDVRIVSMWQGPSTFQKNYCHPLHNAINGMNIGSR